MWYPLHNSCVHFLIRDRNLSTQRFTNLLLLLVLLLFCFELKLLSLEPLWRLGLDESCPAALCLAKAPPFLSQHDAASRSFRQLCDSFSDGTEWAESSRPSRLWDRPGGIGTEAGTAAADEPRRAEDDGHGGGSPRGLGWWWWRLGFIFHVRDGLAALHSLEKSFLFKYGECVGYSYPVSLSVVIPDQNGS